jgi:hypothetical protein
MKAWRNAYALLIVFIAQNIVSVIACRSFVMPELTHVIVSELQVVAEEAVNDIRSWTVNSDTNAWAMGILKYYPIFH